MQLARKKRFRRQYDEKSENYGDTRNDLATVTFQGNDSGTSLDQYESLKNKAATTTSPTSSFPGSNLHGLSEKNDTTCGMFCDLKMFFSMMLLLSI